METIKLNLSLCDLPFTVTQFNLVEGKLQLTLQAEFSREQLNAAFAQAINVALPTANPDVENAAEKAIGGETPRYGEPQTDLEFAAAMHNAVEISPSEIAETSPEIYPETLSEIEETVDEIEDKLLSEETSEEIAEDAAQFIDDAKIGADENAATMTADEAAPAFTADAPTEKIDSTELNIDSDARAVGDEVGDVDSSDDNDDHAPPVNDEVTDEISDLTDTPPPAEQLSLSPPIVEKPLPPRVRFVCPKCHTPGTQTTEKIQEIITCQKCGRAMRLTLKSN